MFTGIVEKLCEVVKLWQDGSILHYAVAIGEKIPLGASVSINGVCQTVVKEEEGVIFFDAIEESCRCSTLGNLKLHDLVNVERAAKIGDEIGGHFISGHISCKALITSIEKNIWSLKVPALFFSYLFPKGFVALHGISLTLCDVDKEKLLFTVHLIPETLKRTNLSQKKVGEELNFESDYLIQAIIESRKSFFVDSSYYL